MNWLRIRVIVMGIIYNLNTILKLLLSLGALYIMWMFIQQVYG